MILSVITKHDREIGKVYRQRGAPFRPLVKYWWKLGINMHNAEQTTAQKLLAKYPSLRGA